MIPPQGDDPESVPGRITTNRQTSRGTLGETGTDSDATDHMRLWTVVRTDKKGRGPDDLDGLEEGLARRRRGDKVGCK